MFNKIKIKLKEWLVEDEIIKLKKEISQSNKNFLDICKDLKSISETNTYENTTMKNNLKEISAKVNSKVDLCENRVTVCENTVKNIVHIGTDVTVNGNSRYGSWAVICIEGNINLVKFVDLNGKDFRDISYFLKQYETGSHCIDTPYKEMFYDLFTIKGE